MSFLSILYERNAINAILWILVHVTRLDTGIYELFPTSLNYYDFKKHIHHNSTIIHFK